MNLPTSENQKTITLSSVVLQLLPLPDISIIDGVSLLVLPFAEQIKELCFLVSSCNTSRPYGDES